MLILKIIAIFIALIIFPIVPLTAIAIIIALAFKLPWWIILVGLIIDAGHSD